MKEFLCNINDYLINKKVEATNDGVNFFKGTLVEILEHNILNLIFKVLLDDTQEECFYCVIKYDGMYYEANIE